MYTRPRCKNFEPLVTSQLRLRNLIRITGINFIHHCDDPSDDQKNYSLYYSLHKNELSPPLYTSELLDFRDTVEWSEINCSQIETSANKAICIRIWSRDKNASDLLPDKMIGEWSVYLSGLELVTNHKDVEFKPDTLLFHLFDKTFTSPDNIIDKTASSVDSTSNSKGQDAVNDSQERKLANPKVRYVHLELSKNEIESSYTIESLLKLQEKQRRLKAKQSDSQTLVDRICTKSAVCINLDLFQKTRSVFYEPHKEPNMGRTLSRLLATYQPPPKPETILEVHKLRLKIECAQFRIKLLTQKRDSNRIYVRHLEFRKDRLKDENTETETKIWNSLRTLSRENVKKHQDKLALQREVFTNLKLALDETKRCLLRELNEIYTVKKAPNGQLTINDIHLPDAESFIDTLSTPTEISIALGFVAHAVLIVARILNIPLRNSIKHEGSRSRIIDNIKILPPSDRM